MRKFYTVSGEEQCPDHAYCAYHCELCVHGWHKLLWKPYPTMTG